MRENDGWTRGMYLPKSEGRYLVKNKSHEYYVFYFDGKEWEYKDDVLAWIEIPKTEIQAPF